MTYTTGPYNKTNETEQWIRITDGCPNQCEYCYAPSELEIYRIPIIERNNVKIMDMNILAVEREQLSDFPLGINQLPHKLHNKIIHYEMICGVDYRYLTQFTAYFLFSHKFGRFNRKGKWQRGIRIAWDHEITKQPEIDAAIDLLLKAGFKPKQIEVFMICDWKIPAEEVFDKVVHIIGRGCMVNDCWYDNVNPPKYQCNYWDIHECKAIRAACRKANQCILWNGIDPEEE